jgi:DNA-directed RNA polymerase
MGLDPAGARSTNLTPGERHDVYQDIADIVSQMVEQDAADGLAEAHWWHGRVDRKVVKRGVMTTPYGVTKSGVRRQLVVDEFVPKDREHAPMASYLGDKLDAALSQSITSGRAIMAWLQTTARRLADAGLPFDWTTPSGSRCRQAYWHRPMVRTNTLIGRLVSYVEDVGSTLSPGKQASGAAPNLVHSFDAAHLALTVNACVAGGITDFAMVHDSFGTHACNTTAMARVLREQFVGIYKEDWLSRVAAEIRAAHPHVDLPPLPIRGSFDIRQVNSAPYFFS